MSLAEDSAASPPFTDLTAQQRQAMVPLHKVVQGLEGQVQGLVACNFPIVASRQVLVVQQGLTQWFLQWTEDTPSLDVYCCFMLLFHSMCT